MSYFLKTDPDAGDFRASMHRTFQKESGEHSSMGTFSSLQFTFFFVKTAEGFVGFTPKAPPDSSSLSSKDFKSLRDFRAPESIVSNVRIKGLHYQDSGEVSWSGPQVFSPIAMNRSTMQCAFRAWLNFLIKSYEQKTLEIQSLSSPDRVPTKKAMIRLTVLKAEIKKFFDVLAYFLSDKAIENLSKENDFALAKREIADPVSNDVLLSFYWIKFAAESRLGEDFICFQGFQHQGSKVGHGVVVARESEGIKLENKKVSDAFLLGVVDFGSGSVKESTSLNGDYVALTEEGESSRNNSCCSVVFSCVSTCVSTCVAWCSEDSISAENTDNNSALRGPVPLEMK